MQYYFILGNNPALSISEISAVLGSETMDKAELPFANVLILETESLRAGEIIKTLGGTIKIGTIKTEVARNEAAIIKALEKIIGKKEGKIHFGFSFYGRKKINLKKIGLETKKNIIAQGLSCRWVTSREDNLSSVIVSENKLLRDNGAEIMIIESGDKFLLGRTEAVQPFKELSFRDYGRPGRDDLSGMLPPKLAQIMINLARAPKNGLLVDPFCGSGTIIAEAALLGYEDLAGADISEKAISDTQKNISWIKDKFQIPDFELRLINKSAAELSKHLLPDSAVAIVTEPYLGPARGFRDPAKIKKELENLYADALREFYKILKKDGRVVMIWPVLNFNKEKIFLNPDVGNFRIINPLPEKFKKQIKINSRGTITYGREGQKVWREIVVLEK